MFAVTVFSTPREAKDPVAQYSLTTLLPMVIPYMQTTSQWQLWNLFAPDPLRRVTHYYVEYQENDQWKNIASIKRGSFSFWRHAIQFKMLGNIFRRSEGFKSPLHARFLHLVCKDHQLVIGTPIRIQFDDYILPKLHQPQSIQWWKEWTPEHSITTGFSTTCPAQSS
jgi:hypothetical protein